MTDEPESPTPQLAQEYLEENLVVIVKESDLLSMLRNTASGQDPDFVYTEFWANQLIEPVIMVSDDDEDCECCHCEAEDDDDCECECECLNSEEDI